MERLDGRVHYTWRLNQSFGVTQYPCYRAPIWLLPGDSYVAGVELHGCDAPALDTKLACVKSLKHLRYITLKDSAITDAALDHLSDLVSLASVDLSGTKITDDGLAKLALLKSLQRLDLSRTQVTDVGLAALGSLKRLQWVNLEATNVTDHGLRPLRRQLPALKVQCDIKDKQPTLQRRRHSS
jgi:hypothetical protein